jgi:hypothetical protein
MPHFRSFFCVLLLASIAAAQPAQPQSQSAPQTPAPASNAQPSTPADQAPDDAKVTGGIFRSAYFKFTYELPKDWKALDDAVRIAANKQYQEQESSPSRVAAPKKRPTTAKPASASKPGTPPPSPMQNFSLLVASPTGVASLESAQMPRVNIWAKRRVPPLDRIEDPAQFMTSMRYAKIIAKPQHVTFDGHDFVRADIQTPSGDYRTQFVTVIGDYLIGFEFLAGSQAEQTLGVDSMKTVKFQ